MQWAGDAVSTTTLRPSAQKLFAMLPRTLIVRHDIVNNNIVATDLLDGVTGKPCGLDASYPGFQKALLALVEAQLVVHAGDHYDGNHNHKGVLTKGRVTQVFISMRPIGGAS